MSDSDGGYRFSRSVKDLPLFIAPLLHLTASTEAKWKALTDYNKAQH